MWPFMEVADCFLVEAPSGPRLLFPEGALLVQLPLFLMRHSSPVAVSGALARLLFPEGRLAQLPLFRRGASSFRLEAARKAPRVFFFSGKWGIALLRGEIRPKRMRF